MFSSAVPLMARVLTVIGLVWPIRCTRCNQHELILEPHTTWKTTHLDSLTLDIGLPYRLAEYYARRRDKVQPTGTMLQFHQKYAISLRGLEREDQLLPVPWGDLGAEAKILDVDEIHGFRDVREGELRIGEDQELLVCGML
jgi:hypothetical protein